MVDIKIWHDIYKSLPDDGERVIIDYFGIEAEAIWRRSMSSWEIWPTGAEARIYKPRPCINPFISRNCRRWRREIFSSFNGNIKEGDGIMNNKKDNQLMVYNIAVVVIFGAVGYMLGSIPGMLIAVGVALLRKWKWKR